MIFFIIGPVKKQKQEEQELSPLKKGVCYRNTGSSISYSKIKIFTFM